MQFSRAIVRPPGRNFADGLTSASEGPPDFAAACRQHDGYCAALLQCGVALTRLLPDPDFPDGPFVEDTAVVAAASAILTRPGAAPRSGEVQSVALALNSFFSDLQRIEAPGTLDGGDVCQADDHFLIGLSARTNEEGAQQLAEHCKRRGHTVGIIDIRASKTLLHLKTGIAYVGEGLWVAGPGLDRDLLAAHGARVDELIGVAAREAYAANCIRVNDSVLIAAGYPRLAAALREKGHHCLAIEVSEFKKMDGGLSCLSLRF